MDLDELGRACDENLAAVWAGFGLAAGYPVETVDTLTLTASGLPIAFFNGAYLRGRTSDPTSAARESIAFFERHALPFLMWVRAGLDDELLVAARAAGLTDGGGPPAMALTSIGRIPPPPAELQLSVAADRSDVPRGCDHSILQSSAMGYPIYRRMGFIDIGQYVQLAGEPGTSPPTR